MRTKFQKFCAHTCREADPRTTVSQGGWLENEEQIFFSWTFRPQLLGGSGGQPDSTDLVEEVRFLCDGSQSCGDKKHAKLVITMAAVKWGFGMLDIVLHDSGGVVRGGADSSNFSLPIHGTARTQLYATYSRLQVRAHTHRHAGIERLFICLCCPSLCLSVSLSAVSFYANQPTIRLAVQLPCDLFASTRQWLIPLVLTKGTSCFGAYEWETGQSAFQSYVYNVATLRR